MDIDPELVAYVATILMTLAATFMGKKWQGLKDKFADSQIISFKFAQGLKVISESIDDDNISPEEEQNIIKAWKDVIDEAGTLVKTSGK